MVAMRCGHHQSASSNSLCIIKMHRQNPRQTAAQSPTDLIEHLFDVPVLDVH